MREKRKPLMSKKDKQVLIDRLKKLSEDALYPSGLSEGREAPAKKQDVPAGEEVPAPARYAPVRKSERFSLKSPGQGFGQRSTQRIRRIASSALMISNIDFSTRSAHLQCLLILRLRPVPISVFNHFILP
jgi:hypothetical protein